eukprot:scaffold269_cov17-Tisochrysis_lutea.AAC.3
MRVYVHCKASVRSESPERQLSKAGRNNNYSSRESTSSMHHETWCKSALQLYAPSLAGCRACQITAKRDAKAKDRPMMTEDDSSCATRKATPQTNMRMRAAPQTWTATPTSAGAFPDAPRKQKGDQRIAYICSFVELQHMAWKS